MGQVATDPANTQVVTPYVQYSITYDDNLLRVRDVAEAQSALGVDQMSDTYRTAIGGIKIDKMLSRQHIKLDASLNRTNYETFTQFNNDGRDFRGTWNWVVGNNLYGDIGYIYSQALTPFQNFRVFTKNQRTQQNKYVSANWRIHPSWTLRSQFTRFGLDYDLAAVKSNTFTQDITEVGIDYTARSNSVVGLQARHTKGTYPYATVVDGVSIDNSFTQDELKARVVWMYSGKTRLQFLGGMVERKRQGMTGANFSGFNARLIGDWAATGKTTVSANLWREIGGLTDVDANYALTTGASVQATLQASYKLRFDGLLDIEKRDYNGASIVTGVTPSGRRDRYEKASFSVTYTPINSLTLVGSIFRENLQSNIDSYGYVSNGVSVTSRYEF